MMTKKLMGWLAAGVLAAATVPGVGLARTVRSTAASHATAAKSPAVVTHAAKAGATSKKTIASNVKRTGKVQKAAHKPTVRKAIHRTPVKRTTSRHVARKSTRHLSHRSSVHRTARHLTHQGKVTSRKLVATHRAPQKKPMKK